MVQTLYYIDEWTDEGSPCDCTLAAWADWLSRPDEDWGRDAPATDGEAFQASTIEELGDIRVEWIGGAWTPVTPIPDGTDYFFLRPHEGGTGWIADFSGRTIVDATDCLDDDEGPLWFACTRDGPPVRLIWRAEGPHMDVEPIQ